MIEHRLIERMVRLLEKQTDDIKSGKPADTSFISAAVDYFRTYADRTHHGKEEDILFRELGKKPLTPEHKTIMQELLDEHTYARKNGKGLSDANESYRKGDTTAIREIQEYAKALTDLYPRHIEKEDKRFFIPVMEYFDEAEQDVMLREFNAFDRNMIHEKYRKTIAAYEAGNARS
jgi:hemerythrin-like domain-containing protein